LPRGVPGPHRHPAHAARAAARGGAIRRAAIASSGDEDVRVGGVAAARVSHGGKGRAVGAPPPREQRLDPPTARTRGPVDDVARLQGAGGTELSRDVARASTSEGPRRMSAREAILARARQAQRTGYLPKTEHSPGPRGPGLQLPDDAVGRVLLDPASLLTRFLKELKSLGVESHVEDTDDAVRARVRET